MTSRGNPSISPPAQISQQRHGNALQSATPPPAQQYYPGQSPALSGGYELIASQQPLLPYQAYGSAVNDVRGQPGNGNRGGPPQQAMHQSGAAFYQQQAGGAMRPPQQGNQSYYISAGALPNNMRATRAHHPAQAQAMLYIPHAPQNPFPTNNMVVYPQRPQMNPGYYASLPQNTYPLYFNPNGANTQWQGPRMPTAGPAPTRPVREKKILEIKDPNTGKVLTDELINSAHAEHAEAEEEPPQNPPNQEISKLFTKMVVESLKSTEDSSTQGVPPDGSQMATSIPPQGPGMQASQQYQQPPPTAAQQPPHMIRPGHPGMAPPRMPQHSHMMHPRPGMMPQQQGQPPATPPHTAEHMVMNFSRPPPPLRQPTPAHVYSTPQQHLVRHPQQQQQQQLPPHQQQQQQMMPPQAMRQPNVPVMPPNQVPVQQQQQQPPVQPQPLMQQQQHQQQPQQPDITPPAAPAPVQAVPEQQSAPASAPTVIPQATHEEKAAEAPAENIPATKVPSPPAKEETPPPQQVEAQPAEKESSPPAEEANKMTEAKDDASQGASNRGAKDGRKGKKNKKDLDKKEIGGSDMDAFIDNQNSKSALPKNGEAQLQNGEAHAANGASVGDQAQQKQQTASSLNRDPKNPWNIRPPLLAGQPRELHSAVPAVSSFAVVENRSLNASSTSKPDPPPPECVQLELPVIESEKPVEAVEAEAVAATTSKSSPSLSSSLATDSVADETNDAKAAGDSASAAAIEEVVENFPELQKTREASKQAETTAQVESKHKLKKKKKRKGRKSPPLSKPKQNAVEEKENDSSTSGKPPLPSSAGERRVSVDKPGPPQEAKPEEQVAAKEESPAPAAVAEAKPESTADKPPRQDEKASSVEEVTAPAPAAKEASPAPVVIIEPATEPAPPAAPVEEDVTAPTPAVNNQNQEEAKTSSQQESSPASEAASSSLPTNDVPSDNTSRNVRDNKDLDRADDSSPQTPVNDENIPPKELSLRPSMEDSRPTPPSRENSVDAPAKSPGDKQAAAKKEGKDNKLQYDRAYLMELRECPSSQTKPEGLPNLEIILDRPVNRAASGTSPDFTPNFFQPSTPQRHPQQMGKSASRGRARPGEMQVPQRVIKSVSIQNDVKALHQSEKPWKPSQKQLATGEISNKVENLESKALFILNRLTPTNFGPLSEEMLGLKINDYEQLEQLVKIFFDKVTLETKFVEAYAKLCKKMCSLKVPPPPGMKEAQASFRVLLLTKCQKEFESDKTVVFEDPEEKKKKLEAEMPEAPDKAEKIETILYHMKLRRLKFYGNIRFIGELFKLSMLTENIMHDCIFGLLKARDDESLLSLCQLISTVGQILDTDKAKQRMDQYFHQMIKIAEERKSRIKFTLKDAIELRRNNWVPRKETTGPKKIDEVRQDFHQEQQTKQFLQNQPPPPRNDPQPGSRRGSRQRQEEKPNDDGWNTVGSKSIRIDASKMKFSKSVVDENIQLGPGGGMNKFSMWSRGSGAASAQSAQDSPASRPANRFSALPSEEDRRFQRSPSRGETGGMGSRGMRQNTAGHGRGKMIGRSSIEGERRDALASARSIVGGRSHNSSRDNSWNRDDRRSLGPRSSREGENQMGPPRTINLRPSAERGPPPPQAAPAPSGAFSNVKKAAPKTEKEMEHSAKTIMDEYLNIQDMKEAKLCLMELEGQKHLPLFVFASINNVLERSDKERILTGQFFQEILKDNTLSLDNFVKGLGEVLQFAEDMVIDIPKMWTNLAQMMTPTLVGGSMPWTLVKSTLGPHLSQDCAAKLIAEILLIAKTLVSESEVARMWQSSGLSWEAFLPADRIADFVQMKKLEFLQGGADNTSPVSSQVNQEAVIGDLVKIIKDGKTNTDIVSFIKDKIPKDLEEKQFIRLLMTAVIKASLSPTLKPNMEVITERQEILQKYINNPNLELQALYAIQALMHCLEHPGGVIATVFEALYNEEVISEEAFKQWEVSSEEQEGKGTCCKQLTRFFTWLRENEDLEAS